MTTVNYTSLISSVKPSVMEIILFSWGAYSLSSVIELNEISITVTSLYVEYSLSRSRSIIHTFRCLWNGGKN